MPISADYPLLEHNTLRVPAVAEWYAAPTDEAGLAEALAFAASRKLAITVLGEGSNVVLPDRLQGLVIRPMSMGLELLAETESAVDLRVGAGENWHRLVLDCLRRGWHGLENLALIPGSVGAAPVQNIGAYGVDLADFVRAVEVVDVASGQRRILSADVCDFGYRDSRFRVRDRDRLIIVALQLRLSREASVNIDYPSLQAAFADRGKPTPAEVFEQVVQLRSRLPDPQVLPNVGSFFKNPLVSDAVWRRLQRAHPQLIAWPQAPGQVKIGAGWMLEQLGWSGRRHSSGVRVHDAHALVLINDRGLGADAIRACSGEMRETVQHRFGVLLEEEPRVFS